jgi:chemotaxis protein MotB
MPRTSARWIALCCTLSMGIPFIGCGPSEKDLEAERARVRQLQAELEEAQQQRKDLDERLQALRARNDELTSRLQALGQSLEEVEGDRKTLQETLDETKRALEELRERERQAQKRLATFRDLLNKFQSMIESGQLRVRVVRNRMVVELPEGVLFDSARAALKREGEATLAQVAPILSDIEGRQFQIAGHTDNIPIRTVRFPSNWELSTARAVAVTRFLIEQGMPAERLSAAGYAETEPVADNDTPEGRAKNRRIEIVLVPALDELPDLSGLEEEAED